MKNNSKYFFCGIGGSGMSALAKALKNKGAEVTGSDRNLDAPAVKELENLGIKVFTQDGAGVPDDAVFVISSAIEDTVPDVVRAKDLGLVIKKRAEILAEILHSGKGVAVAGTSGKTTTTAMLGWILDYSGMNPDIMNGGVMLNYNSNVRMGSGEAFVVEADESDGSIELYTPDVALVTNISLDHKPLEELRVLFKDFVKKAKFGAVLNADCPEVAAFTKVNPNTITFSAEGRKATFVAEDVKITPQGSLFTVNGIKFEMPVVGRHNVADAMAAISAAFMLGVPLEKSAQGLKEFKGVHRRMELMGEVNGVKVFDDFAHNPAKIEGTLRALKEAYPESVMFVVFQPHGFAPTKLMKDGLVDALDRTLSKNDRVIFLNIFYAGGTAAKDISSADLVEVLKDRAGVHSFYSSKRKWALKYIKDRAKAGDIAVIMGARDDTLSDLAKELVEGL